MAKSDVLGLVVMLSNNQADAATITSIYDEIVNEWAASNYYNSNVTLCPTSPLDSEFSLPEPIRNVKSVVWDDMTLSLLSLRELESMNSEWRNESGTPVAFTNETETVKTLALYPSPFGASNAPGADPLGAGYPTYNAVVFHSEFRTDVNAYWELPLAFLILQREFIRESNHTDSVFAEFCGTIGQAMLRMVE